VTLVVPGVNDNPAGLDRLASELVHGTLSGVEGGEKDGPTSGR
jgi:hypothetical protein